VRAADIERGRVDSFLKDWALDLEEWGAGRVVRLDLLRCEHFSARL
jgi:hypothetical protein